MIECSTEKIWYKKGIKKHKRFLSLFLLFLFVFASITHIFFVIPNNVFNYCYDSVYSIITDSINSSIHTSLNEKLNYNDIIHIEKDNQGNLSLMTVNSQKINSVTREVVKKTQEILSVKVKEGISVPYLAFSGISFISGYGKTFKLKTLSVSSVLCDFLSDFKSVGINQTLHSIYVEVIAKVNIDCSFSSNLQESSSKILICETILVGKVPETYLNGKLFS